MCVANWKQYNKKNWERGSGKDGHSTVMRVKSCKGDSERTDRRKTHTNTATWGHLMEEETASHPPACPEDIVGPHPCIMINSHHYKALSKI